MYLLDEYDLKVFHTDDEKSFFKEVVNTYYASNYRSSIVMLYSLVVLNLYNKLQVIANENPKAETKLKEINKKIKDNSAKYSEIERELTSYFTDNHSLAFTPISKDMDYLKSLRDDCTHLSVNNERLFVPKEYQVRMMIISMYDNIFSKEPPFIQNLYNYLEDKLEFFGQVYGPYKFFEEKEYLRLNKLYFSRMNEESIEKSIKSFIKFSFFPPIDFLKKKDGAFYILYNLVYYCEEIGLFSIWSSLDIQNKFLSLDSQIINNSENQKQLYELIKISTHFRDMIKEINEEFFSMSVNNNLYSNTKEYMNYAKRIYPNMDIFNLLKEKKEKFTYININEIYKGLSDEIDKVSCNEFALEAVELVPCFNGFDTADYYFDFLKEHFLEFGKYELEKVFDKIEQNDQFINRRRFNKDIEKIIELNKKRKEPVNIPEEWQEKEEE